ncbi:TetR/AcrR family transcriptional regulator [Actinomadura rugatobispora]|uniref:TetR/AcrR family transcriptional regulator n=1 Tax=Actinomadura rugatobispora TaxID=1994 RepID=A0ABW1A2W9_9ACTN|nr:TetR/AcrR family transcriptional regulator [Actinomadura rugatobispora]
MERLDVPLGRPRGERADAARNRLLLLDAAREMLAEVGAEKVTMDGLAERAGLGKGTVFRRFGTRAGIFHALLDEDERLFQERVLSGPPPLGPGAGPVERLVAYGRSRIEWLLERHALARAALDRAQPVPAGAATLSQLHIRVLLRQADLGLDDVDGLALQLTGALEGPVLLYLSLPEQAEAARDIERLAGSWQFLVERVCRA